MAEDEVKHVTTSLRIPPEDRERLEEIARAHGFFQPRGPGAGKLGNISALICAIARGEYTLVERHKDNHQSDG